MALDQDSLNSLVTSAIWRAEQLDELSRSAARAAWMEVSQLEEELATALPNTLAEGRIARRGAVRAALKAQDYARATALARRYAAEEGATHELQAAFDEMMREDARQLARQFPYAAKRHPIDVVREVAQWIGQTGAFGLAA